MSTGFPLFSIITVTLNCADDAVRTAQSVLAQDHNDFEYIIKDGGSTDGTVEGLRNLGIEQIHVSPDSGIFDAMQQALTLCRGEFIHFLNAGDLFVNSVVLSQIASMINVDDPIDFYYGDVIFHTRHPYFPFSENKRVRWFARSPDRLGRFHLFRLGLCHQAWFVRHRLYEQRPFDPQFPLMADYDFLLYQILRCKTKYRHLPVFVADYASGGRTERDVERGPAIQKIIVSRYYSAVERLLYDSIRFMGRALLKFTHRTGLYASPRYVPDD